MFDDTRPAIDWDRAGWTTTPDGDPRIFVPVNLRPYALAQLEQTLEYSWSANSGSDTPYLTATIETVKRVLAEPETVIVLENGAGNRLDYELASASVEQLRQRIQGAVDAAVGVEARKLGAEPRYDGSPSVNPIEQLAKGLRTAPAGEAS